MTPQEVEQIIEMLVEKLGPIGGQVWNILTKQVAVEIRIGQCVLAIFLALTVASLLLGIVGAVSKALKTRRQKYHYDVEEWLMIVAVFLGITSAVFLVVCAWDVIPKMLNPEYYAIQMLLGR